MFIYMRIFAVLLCCLNIVYFVWSLAALITSDKSDVSVQQPSRQAPKTLELLSELELGEFAQQEQN